MSMCFGLGTNWHGVDEIARLACLRYVVEHGGAPRLCDGEAQIALVHDGM